MSENRQQNSSKNRMDKFLYYAKFGLLIIVALMFMIGYSFYQQELPSGTAQLHIDSPQTNSINTTSILIVIDFESYYQEDNHPYINLIDAMTGDIENLDYDLLLLDSNSMGTTILDSINDSLLLRIYQEKKYDYIVAVGDKAIMPSKEIKELFLPKTKILLYNTTSAAIYNSITPVDSVMDYVEHTISLVNKMNPDSRQLLFVYNNDEYSYTILNIAKDYIDSTYEYSYQDISAGSSNIDETVEYINNMPHNTSVFYVSSYASLDDNNVNHCDIINKLQTSTDKLIYDLSPLYKDDCTRMSLRYYPIESDNTPVAYIALSPEGACEANYEFIDYAVPNIQKAGYADTSLYISWCMDNININDFPDALHEQYDYCDQNSLFIEKDALQPGDLLFLSNTQYSNNVDLVGIYINENIMISENADGELSFMQIKSEDYIVSFAHPYTFLKTQEN